ncbi:hypothetical protein G7046_g9968 [Stylonectria norvegica]|nr:hypothetical protein G7046_g9968 [Stylonectria norvegica]
MMALETIVLDHVPASYALHLAFFRNIQNASFLHQQLLARNTDFEYAFIDASVVVSRLHLLSAVFRAVSSAAGGVLKTPNVHSEMVVSLSPSNNIAEAYRRFGISPSTKDLIAIKVTVPNEDNVRPVEGAQIWEHLRANIEGEAEPLTDASIAAVTDSSKVRKYYKLNGLKWLDSIQDIGARNKETDMLVLGAMALRGV